MGIREEWLNDDESVYSDKLVTRLLAYVAYVKEKYPNIDAEAKNHLNSKETE